MKGKHHYHKGDRGLEIAINPDDLRVIGKCRIFEQQSTSGFEEVPEIEYPSTFAPTNKMIQYDQSWFVEFKWRVFGPLACLLDCGYWKTQVLFEWMGGGETNFKPEVITQDLGRPGQEYTARLQINPRSLRPGVYRVICCLQYCFQNGKPGPIAGFEDKGLIKIYEDKRVVGSYTTGNGFVESETVTS